MTENSSLISFLQSEMNKMPWWSKIFKNRITMVFCWVGSDTWGASAVLFDRHTTHVRQVLQDWQDTKSWDFNYWMLLFVYLKCAGGILNLATILVQYDEFGYQPGQLARYLKQFYMWKPVKHMKCFSLQQEERRLQCKCLAVEPVEPMAWVIVLQGYFKGAGRRLEWFGIAQLYESVDETWSCKMFQLVKSILVLFFFFFCDSFRIREEL